ncbi:hypothetical protein D3C81_956310 [compost metagenome]
MMRRPSSHRPPSRSNSSEVSPRLPPVLPSSAGMRLKSPARMSSALRCRVSSVRRLPSAVAPLMPSGSAPPKVIASPSTKPGAAAEPSGCGSAQLVICSGKAISRATRASIAGLNGFWPMPPYSCLPMPMANRLPPTPIHQGADGGSDSASSQPVSSAEPSSRRASGWPSRRRHTASVASALAQVSSHRLIAGQPNRYRPHRVAGSSARQTSSMMRLTAERSWANGPEATLLWLMTPPRWTLVAPACAWPPLWPPWLPPWPPLPRPGAQRAIRSAA